jgi:hypothetical protein
MRDNVIVFSGHSHSVAVEYSPSVGVRGGAIAMRQIFSGVPR